MIHYPDGGVSFKICYITLVVGRLKDYIFMNLFIIFIILYSTNYNSTFSFKSLIICMHSYLVNKIFISDMSSFLKT